MERGITMSLLKQLTTDMVTAMKERDKDTLKVVRMLKAAVQNEKIELGHELSENEEVAVMSREFKQRKESLAEFEKAGRDDLVEATKKELAVVEKYLPKQLSDEEVKKVVRETIDALGADSMKNFGQVMGSVMPKLKGKADGKLINQTVKDELSNK